MKGIFVISPVILHSKPLLDLCLHMGIRGEHVGHQNLWTLSILWLACASKIQTKQKY